MLGILEMRKNPKIIDNSQTESLGEERIVISTECGRERPLLEKEEAGKPLYLKRV